MEVWGKDGHKGLHVSCGFGSALPHLLVSALKDVAILFSEFYCLSYQNLF